VSPRDLDELSREAAEDDDVAEGTAGPNMTFCYYRIPSKNARSSIALERPCIGMEIEVEVLDYEISELDNLKS